MSRISWSEFIIVWLTVCVVIDIVLTYFNKKNEAQGVSEAEERKARIKRLNTPYRDDVAYETVVRCASMVKVDALPSFEEPLSEETQDKGSEGDEEEKVELTELQQETSDIVKMLFG